MRPFWFGTTGNDHLGVGYASPWMTDNRITTLCGRVIQEDVSTQTGNRCRLCIRSLRALLK